MMIERRSWRAQFWQDVEQFFGELPPNLFRQGLLQKNNLTASYGEGGHLMDILSREDDYPLLSMYIWLLDDLGVPEDQVRWYLERHLFLAMFFSFAAKDTHEKVLDRDTFYDEGFLYLESALTRRSTFHLAQLFPEDSPFWGYHSMFWNDYAEANMWEWQAHAQEESLSILPADAGQVPSIISEHDAAGKDYLGHRADRLAPAKLSIAAVVLYTGHGDRLPRLLKMIDHLNRVFQARYDILSLKHDLFLGHLSYPIVRTMTTLGIDPRVPFDPEQVLGAAILTGSVKKVCQDSLDDLEACREIARELNLPTWTAYLDTLEQITRELLSLFTFGASAEPAAGRRRAAFVPYQDTLAQAVKMAEGYLLSDLTFRESWEVQRYTLNDIPEVTCKNFPSGFILELLCANGHDLSAQVDEIFNAMQRADFKYWENYDIAPDADDLGLLLRLYRYSAQKDAHRKTLRRPLRWMESNILPSGEFPVFFTKDVNVPIGSVLYWGGSCISVECNLLLGLIDYDWEKYRPLIERSALNLVDRVLANGLGITAHYDSLYALWIVLKLTAQLPARHVGEVLHARIAQIRAVLHDRLAVETKRIAINPQDAALLSLTCLEDEAAKSFFVPGWIRILLKHQRYDGSWQGQPFYMTPNRNSMAVWYTSRTLTTAFCYYALQTYRKYQP